MVKTLMDFDKNGDGQVTRDELPERMQGLLDRGDTDQNGVLTVEEIRKSAQSAAAPVLRGRRSRVFAGDTQFAHHGIESGSRHAQPGCGLADHPACFTENSQDVHSFHELQGAVASGLTCFGP